MAVTLTSLLTETQLETFRSRAPGYDRDNKFFQEDFDELKKAGYLKMAVPSELGGLGFKLAEVARETRRVAMYAPSTALGTNMHNYWVGLSADLWRGGDKSLEWLAARSGRRRSLRRGPCGTRERPPAAALDDQGRARRRRLGLHRQEVVRQPDTGVDSPRRARPGHQQPVRAKGRARVPPAQHARHHDQGDVGRSRHARHAQRRHGARTGLLSGQVHRPHRPRRRRRYRWLRDRDLRLGLVELRQRLLRPGVPRPRS